MILLLSLGTICKRNVVPCKGEFSFDVSLCSLFFVNDVTEIAALEIESSYSKSEILYFLQRSRFCMIIYYLFKGP